MVNGYPNTPPHIRRKVASKAGRYLLEEDDQRHPLHGQRPAKHRLPPRNSFLDSTEALTTSKQDARTILWVEEWNALGERSTEWRDRGIIPNEHLASGTDEEFESAESAERTLSGHDENVEALLYRCMWLCGEADYVSYYDMCRCPQLHVDIPGYANPCRCQLCQTLGGIEYRGLDEEEAYPIHFVSWISPNWLPGLELISTSITCPRNYHLNIFG